MYHRSVAESAYHPYGSSDELQCDNCGDWFRDDSYRWESFRECPHCGTPDAQPEEEE